jgi:hypothetical protein
VTDDALSECSHGGQKLGVRYDGVDEADAFGPGSVDRVSGQSSW